MVSTIRLADNDDSQTLAENDDSAAFDSILQIVIVFFVMGFNKNFKVRVLKCRLMNGQLMEIFARSPKTRIF